MPTNVVIWEGSHLWRELRDTARNKNMSIGMFTYRGENWEIYNRDGEYGFARQSGGDSPIDSQYSATAIGASANGGDSRTPPVSVPATEEAELAIEPEELVIEQKPKTKGK